MTLGRVPIRCEVKEEHEIAVYINIVLPAVAFSSDVCRTPQKRHVAHDGRFFHDPFLELRPR